jgi:hypothetical protein
MTLEDGTFRNSDRRGVIFVMLDVRSSDDILVGKYIHGQTVDNLT